MCCVEMFYVLLLREHKGSRPAKSLERNEAQIEALAPQSRGEQDISMETRGASRDEAGDVQNTNEVTFL